VAELDVQASFTPATNQSPGPLWLSLSISGEDGLAPDIRFPNPAYPEVTWPIKGVVLTSEGLGAVTVPIKCTELVYQSIEYHGMVIVEIASDWEGASLAEIRPLVIGIIVETATDRGQALALASQSMRLERD